MQAETLSKRDNPLSHVLVPQPASGTKIRVLCRELQIDDIDEEPIKYFDSTSWTSNPPPPAPIPPLHVRLVTRNTMHKKLRPNTEAMSKYTQIGQKQKSQP
ncbi:hypothetical protein ACJMK2_017863 [Sinanodonta woodiana]|uniref:Uncharacterized protein n=1 Tax=Sinanodonta woodiana TaxID=1069815 RepID=A0ABD3UD71_SINWO